MSVLPHSSEGHLAVSQTIAATCYGSAYLLGGDMSLRRRKWGGGRGWFGWVDPQPSKKSRFYENVKSNEYNLSWQFFVNSALYIFGSHIFCVGSNEYNMHIRGQKGCYINAIPNDELILDDVLKKNSFEKNVFKQNSYSKTG